MVKDILWDVIPDEEKKRIISQYHCEYECDFLGFTDVYMALSNIIPKHYTVIDFGCYLAAQCYCFSQHKKYIGVDVVNMERFTLPNVEHYVGKIQDYISGRMETVENDTTFAICSYVPDNDARELVRRNFKNVFVYYPAGNFVSIMR